MFTADVPRSIRSRQAGISLVELIMFIVIVSVGIAGILVVMNTTTRHSADPLLRKQALAIAESVLEEVMLMPFTYCDPDDPAAEAASGAGDCTAGMDQNNGGGVFSGTIPAGEVRGGLVNPRDNVADYAGFSMNGISDISGTAVPGLAGYTLQPIAVSRIALPDVPGGAALQITVTVTDPQGDSITLDGIRTRYAPNALP